MRADDTAAFAGRSDGGLSWDPSAIDALEIAHRDCRLCANGIDHLADRAWSGPGTPIGADIG